MALTYEPIATTTLGSASTISFTSIPSTYTDLRVVLFGTSTNNGYYTGLTLNSTTNVYSTTYFRGNGTTASASLQTANSYMTLDNGSVGSSSTIPQLLTLDIFSYTATTYKTILATVSQSYNGSGEVTRTVGLFRDTVPIDTILLTSGGSSTWKIGTTATLYGIKAA